MFLRELFENQETIDDPRVKYIKDIIMYLKICNIQTVRTKSVLKELESRGVVIDFEELSDILMNQLKLVNDVTASEIIIGEKPEEEKKERKQDNDKIVKNMAQNALKRRE